MAGLLGPDVELEAVVVSTTGDRRADVGIGELAGQGVFVREVQAAVLEGRADIAVHSAKDLTSTPVDGLVIGAFPERADARDALVGSRLDDLPTGARVGTGSPRRAAQLLASRPDLVIAGLRGNMETRLARVRPPSPGSAGRDAEGFDAIVVAMAALDRLGRSDEAAEVLDPSSFVPQVGQGALAVECRAGAEEVMDMLRAVDDPRTRRAVESERAWLRRVGGGCDQPVGAHATVSADGMRSDSVIELTGFLASPDGRGALRRSARGADPEELGRRLATEMLDAAGRDLLD